MIFLTPDVFRPTSTLGCAGLLDVYRAGHVTICNAVGTGISAVLLSILNQKNFFGTLKFWFLP